MYKIFDYQMYVGNETRDTVNYQLPGVTAFERWLFISYQALQARIKLANVAGIKDPIPDQDDEFFVEDRAMNEYTSMEKDWDRENKKFIKHNISDKYKLPVRDPALRSQLAPGEHVDIYDSSNYVYSVNYSNSHPSL